MVSLFAAIAAASDRMIELHGGVGALAATSDRGAHMVGRITLSGERLGFEAGAREGVALGEHRTLGVLFFGGRWAPSDSRWHGRAGFSHAHEVPMAVFTQQPIASLMGTGEGIHHRSGAEVGVGWSAPAAQWFALPEGWADRVGVSVDLSVTAFPDPHGPALYGFLDVTARIGVGARRRAVNKGA